jgi:hypothetical protein
MREGIYRKTDAGRDEIRDRSRRLPPALRTMLLMVDGQRTLSDLRQVAGGVRAPDDALERLLAEGLIEPTTDRFDVEGLMRAASAGSAATSAAAMARSTPASALSPPGPVAQEPAVVVDASVADAAMAPAPTEQPTTPGVDAEHYVRLYGRMSEAVRAHLGLRGYFLQLKIERCTDAAGLRMVLPELRQALARSKGDTFAADWERALVEPA